MRTCSGGVFLEPAIEAGLDGADLGEGVLERLQVGPIDQAPGRARNVVAGGPPVVAAVEAHRDPVVVEEDEPHLVHPPLAIPLPEPVLRDVPRRQPAALVAEDMHALEPLEPVVEILLIAELAVLEPVIAPLDAAVMPPVKRLEAALVAAKGHELHVVDAVLLLLRVFRREAMGVISTEASPISSKRTSGSEKKRRSASM